MADDDKMMKDLEGIANKSDEASKKEDRPSFGPGSGPMRGRRRAGGEAVAPPPPPKPKIRDERVPNAVGTLVLGLVGFAVTLIGLLTIMTHLFMKMGGVFSKNIPNFGYALVALGFYLLAKNRWRTHKTFQVASWKDRRDPHAWKLPLIWMQAFMLDSMAIYTLGVGFNWWHSATNLVLLSLGLFVFLGYLLWYLIASFSNRFPSIAGLRVAMVGLLLAIASYIAWTLSQFVVISLIFGFYALVASIASTAVVPFGSPLARGNWMRVLCMIGTVLLLIPIGINAMPFGKPRALLVNLGPAIQGLKGDIETMNYSQDGSMLAVAQRVRSEWYLRVIKADSEPGKILKVKAGHERFRPVFIQNGRSVILDPVRDKKVRGLWKVDAESGQITVINDNGIEPLGEGTPWSEKCGRFLYVIKGQDGYRLIALDPVTNKSEVLFQSFQAILSPSWTREANQVAYVRATKQNTAVYVMDLLTKKQRLLAANDPDVREESLFVSQAEETARKLTFLKRFFTKKEPPVLMLYAVVPAIDGFRYLYLAKKDDETSFWIILPDGSKRVCIYRTDGAVEQIAWLKGGHKIFFQERQKRYGFMTAHYNIKMLDADLFKVEDLIPPQMSNRAPALSPDGVKVAFTGRSGLWYPSGGHLGIWVAVLR